MKTFSAFFLGLVLGGSAVAAYSYFSAVNQAKTDKNTAEILTKLAFAEDIRDKLGDDYAPKDGYNTLFTVKDSAVVIVERNGIKTLRVFNPSPKN